MFKGKQLFNVKVKTNFLKVISINRNVINQINAK